MNFLKSIFNKLNKIFKKSGVEDENIILLKAATKMLKEDQEDETKKAFLNAYIENKINELQRKGITV